MHGVKIRREKVTGLKLAVVRMTGSAEDWHRSASLTLNRSIEQATHNQTILRMKLAEYMGAMALDFYAPEEPEEKQQSFSPVALGRFVLQRDQEYPEFVELQWEFMVPLEMAKHWIISQIGEQLLCTVSKAQMSLRV